MDAHIVTGCASIDAQKPTPPQCNPLASSNSTGPITRNETYSFWRAAGAMVAPPRRPTPLSSPLRSPDTLANTTCAEKISSYKSPRIYESARRARPTVAHAHTHSTRRHALAVAGHRVFASPNALHVCDCWPRSGVRTLDTRQCTWHRHTRSCAPVFGSAPCVCERARMCVCVWMDIPFVVGAVTVAVVHSYTIRCTLTITVKSAAAGVRAVRSGKHTHTHTLAHAHVSRVLFALCRRPRVCAQRVRHHDG